MRCARTAAGQFLKTFCDHLAERDQQRKICRVGTSKGAVGMLNPSVLRMIWQNYNQTSTYK